MGLPVLSGAMAQCSFALGPFNLMAVNNVMFENKPVLTVKDVSPGANVVTAGRMCTSMGNPAVSAATAAALGVLTPQPCTLAPAGMWKPGTINAKVKNFPVLDNTCTLNCVFGGIISVLFPGSLRTLVK